MARSRAAAIVTHMMLRTRVSRVVPGTVLLLAVATTAGCGDDGGPGGVDPALCSSVDALKSSVAGLTDISLDVGALADLQSGLTEVQKDLGDVQDDAGDEFSSEIDAVKKAVSDLGTTVQTAAASPSLQTVSTIGPSVQAVGTSITKLASSVGDAC